MSLTCRTAREKTARVFPQPRVPRRKSIYSLTSIQPNPTAPQIAWALLVWRVAPCGSGMRHSSYTLHIYTWTDAEPGIRTGWPVHAGSAEKETLAAVFLYLRNEEARNKKREKEERSCAARMEASKVQASSRWITTFTNPWFFFWSQQSLWLRTPTIQLEQSLFLFWMTGVMTLLESQLYCKNISDSLGQTAVYKSPTVGRLLIMRETKVLNCRQINY